MSDMIPGGYCRDCKWWDRHGVDDTEGGVCLMTDQPETLAVPWSDSDSFLDTKADFGCVQWKRKSE